MDYNDMLEYFTQMAAVAEDALKQINEQGEDALLAALRDDKENAATLKQTYRSDMPWREGVSAHTKLILRLQAEKEFSDL